MIFLFATELEAKAFRIAAPHATIEICGVGAAQCAASTAHLISRLRAQGERKTLILAGIAGSYSLDNVALGEVVEVVSEQIAALPKRFSVTYHAQSKTTLRAVSSNSVNSQGESPTDADIENMEGAVFMAICQREEVEFIHIRAISNLVGASFAQWSIEEACRALCESLCSLQSVSNKR
ncbi:MAG: hypothetical protein SNH73_07490 [Rikenellaceae bacterium]